MIEAQALSSSPRVGQSSPSSVVGNALYAVGGSISVDGRLSWYGNEHQGRYVPFNTYLLKEAQDLLLLESGVPATFASTASQLREILGADAEVLRLAVTRNEPDCVANVPHLVRQFALKTVHSPGLMNTLQFFRADQTGSESTFQHRSTELQMLNFGVGCRPAIPGGEVPVSDERSLEVVAVPLKVLPTVWYYDSVTRTMFCSDSFSDETAVAPDMRVISSVDERDILVGRARRHFSGKFDWLLRSELSSVIADLEGIFGRYDIEILAPTRGAVIQGRPAVEAKMNALLTALSGL